MKLKKIKIAPQAFPGLGTDTKPFVLPSEGITSGVTISFTGTEGYGVAPTTPSLQNPFAPAVTELLGLLSFDGKAVDGVGMGIKQIPFQFLDYRSKALLGVGSTVTDVNGVNAHAFNYSFFFPFFDPRVPFEQQFFQMYNPARYGNNGALRISTGQLLGNNVTNDITALIASTGSGAAVNNGVIQMVAHVWDIDPLKYLKMPLADLAFEYYHPYFTVANGPNGQLLVNREIQNRTYLMYSQLNGSGVETASNAMNTNTSNGSEIITRFGATGFNLDVFAPNIQAENAQKYFTSGAGAPTGTYILDHKHEDSFFSAYDLDHDTGANHFLDTNCPVGGTQTLLRIIHECYNKNKVLADGFDKNVKR